MFLGMALCLPFAHFFKQGGGDEKGDDGSEQGSTEQPLLSRAQAQVGAAGQSVTTTSRCGCK